MTTPFEDSEWEDYARRVLDDLVPKIQQSSVTVSLVPTGQTDVKFALELGLTIMLDKPIVLVVQPGSRVPAKLAAIADAIVEGDVTTLRGRDRLVEALNRLASERGE